MAITGAAKTRAFAYEDFERLFFLPNVNMFGYGQVDSKYGSGQFSKDLEREFPDEEALIVSKIENRDKILPSIKDFLGKGK